MRLETEAARLDAMREQHATLMLICGDALRSRESLSSWRVDELRELSDRLAVLRAEIEQQSLAVESAEAAKWNVEKN